MMITDDKTLINSWP